jgi:hypothetical protein
MRRAWRASICAEDGSWFGKIVFFWLDTANALLGPNLAPGR